MGKKLIPFMVMAAASAAVSIWTQELEGAFSSHIERSLAERMVIAGRVPWFYLGKVMWPAELMFIYPQWFPQVSQPAVWLPVGLIALLAAAAFIWRKGRLRSLYLALGLYLASLLPVLGLVDHYFLRYSAVGDHFQYLASMVPLASIAAAIHLSGRWLGRRGTLVTSAALVLIATALMARTRQHIPVFRTNERLWEHAVAHNPTAGMALANLGVIRSAQGRPAEGIDLFRKAIEQNPRDVTALYNLGIGLGLSGQFDEALKHLTRANEERPDDSGILGNLGAVLRGAGHLDEALAMLRRACAIDSDNAIALYNLTEILVDQRQADEAIQRLEAWLTRHPQDTRARQLLARAFAMP